MTMSDSPITDVIATAIEKSVHFNPHLHPRDSHGRFASKPGGGRTLDSEPSDWGYQEGDRIQVVGRPPSGARGNGDVIGWTGRGETFRVQLDDGRVVDLPMEHLQAADPRNDTRAMVRRQRTEQARLGQELKDEEGNAIGSPNDWSAGNRVVLRDGSYIGRDDQYPNALFIDEPGANMQYDVSPEDIFDFARTKQ